MNRFRQETVENYIEENGKVTIDMLQKLCPDVSLMTIHRDLNALQQAGKIMKVRGGAIWVRHEKDPVFEDRMKENTRGKELIAQKALGLLDGGRSLFLDAGTTCLAIAHCLPEGEYPVFTTSLHTAMALCHLQSPQIVVCGGVVSRRNFSLSGQNTLNALRDINFDIAFVGVSGCRADVGFTCGTESDRQVKQSVLKRAGVRVLVCDRSKFYRLMPYTFAAFSDIDYLISDDAVPADIRAAAEKAGVTIL